MANEKTPNQRLNELRQAAADERARLQQNPAMSREELGRSAAVLLSLRALETGALGDKGTVAAIDRTWQKNTEFFNRHAQEFAERTGPEKLRQMALSADGGKELTDTFSRYIQTLDRIPEDTPSHLMGSAGSRINRLKERMDQGAFATPDRKRMVLAEIAAARESVKAETDTFFFYDWHLRLKTKPDVSVNARRIEQELAQIPDEQIDRIFSKAKGKGYGQSVIDALDKRRTPVQKEIQAVKKFGYSLNRDHVVEAAAQLIWLSRNPDLTRQELAEAKDDDTMRDEVKEIADSPAFKRFVGGRSQEELGNLIQNLNPMAPDGMKPLTDAFETAGREQEMFDREYDPIYQSLFGTQQVKNQLMNDLGGLLSNEEFRTQLDNNGMGREALSSLNRLNDAMYEDDPQAVKEAIDKARNQMTALQFDAGDNPKYQQFFENFPAFGKIRNKLQLPEHGTGREFAMAIRGFVLSEGPRSAGGHKYLFRKVLFAQETRKDPDWENKKIDKDALVKQAEELEQQTIPLGNVLEELSAEAAYQIVDANDGGAKAEKYLTEWMQDRVRARQEIHEQTPEERVEELLSLPLRERYIKLMMSNKEDRSNTILEMLAARSLSREYGEHPEKFQTAEEVDQRFEEIRSSYSVFDKPLNYIQQNEMEHVWWDPTGADLEASFKKRMIGADRVDYWQAVDPVMYPTARQQIEGLQRAIQNNELTNREKKRGALAQILAAREMLHVRRGIRGGDERLDQTMTAEVFSRAEEIYNTLGRLPAEQLNALCDKAKEGHGGVLEEDYHALLRKQAAARDRVEGDPRRDQLPTAKERIEALQARLRGARDQAEQLRCVAGIIAARQTVGAQRGGRLGGDKRLNNTLDARKLEEREQDVAEYLSNLPDATLRTLVSQAAEGHGGAMTETYKAANTYGVQLDALRTRAARGEQIDPARALELHVLIEKGLKSEHDSIDESIIKKNMNQIRKMPGYREFAEDPKTLELLKDGDYRQLTVQYRDHVKTAFDNQTVDNLMQQWEVLKKPEEEPGPEQQMQ